MRISSLIIKLKIENYDCIKSLQLPPGWTENKLGGGFAPRTMRAFSPPDNPRVKIVLLNRGLPVSEDAGKTFRKILQLSPKLIFDRNSANKLMPTEVQLICDLEEILGNAGDNQIVNPDTGISGPPFILDRLEVLVCNDRPALAVRGWFCNPGNGQRLNAFYGLFVDVNARDDACGVEQIFLEAPEETLYLQYLPAFEQCLHSIEWLATASQH